MEFHLFGYNLELFTRPGVFLNVNQYLLPESFNIALLALAFVLVKRDWREKPDFLRRGLIMLVPMLTLAMLFGILDEVRSYLESLPILLLLCYHSLMRLFRVELELASQRQ